MTSPQFPLHVETLADAITVVGIELRTSNPVAAQTIPPHWQRGDLTKTFIAEYEQCRANGDIAVSIGLGATATTPA